MQHILAVLSTDDEYACCLMEFLNEQDDCLFCARAFTNAAAYLEFEKQHEVDLLLFDQTILVDMPSQTSAKAVLYLSENPKETDHEGVRSIFMYQSAKKLMEQAITAYESAGNTLPDFSKTLKTNVYGVCLASGDCRQSIFSLALADCYAKNKKTLFISLQPFVTAEIFQKQEKASLSEAIYVLKQEDSNKTSKIKELIESHDGLDYLLGVEHFSDLSEITREEAAELIVILSTHCSYDTIIIDLPVLTKGLNDWLCQCEKIFELILFGGIQEQAYRQFHKQLALQEEGISQLNFEAVDCSRIDHQEDILMIQAVRTGAWGELAKQYCEA